MSSSSELLPSATGWRSVTSSTFPGLGGLVGPLAPPPAVDFSARFCCILSPVPPPREIHRGREPGDAATPHRQSRDPIPPRAGPSMPPPPAPNPHLARR